VVRSAPRTRREGLVVEHVGAEILVYDLERHRAHCLNPTAALVWSACDGRRDAAAIAREIAREVPEASVELVQVALVKLERAHLLAAPAGGIPRRAALRRLTLAAGLMPVVSSILVPEAAQAASCSQVGGCCASKDDCCPPLQCTGGQNVPPCTVPPRTKSCR
jgi:hypothetical protein